MGEDENESGGPCWQLNRSSDQSIPIKLSNSQTFLDFVDIGGEAHPHPEYERHGDPAGGASPRRPGHPGPRPDGQGVGPDVHVQPAQPTQPEPPAAEGQDVPNGSPR